MKKYHIKTKKKEYIFLLTNFIGILLLVYLLFFIFMIIFQDEFLYHPSSKNFLDCDGFENYQREEFNSTRFYYKELKGSDRVIIYYSGNSGRACDRSPLTRVYEGYQASVIFVEYSGYGGDNQTPSLALLQQDVLNIIEFTKSYSSVFVVGESLGSSLASFHSLNRNVELVLLLAPFYSTPSLGQEVFPFYPVSFLSIENYDTASWLENYQNRLVIIHGKEDKNIPYTQAVTLYQRVNSKDKHLFLLSTARHNNLYNFMDTRRIIRFAFTNRTFSDSIFNLKYKEE